MKPKILVVEDDEGVRKSTADFLSSDFDVVLAADTDEGFNAIRENNLMDNQVSGHQIDLIISDISMPGLVAFNGPDMVEKIAEAFSFKKAIMPPVIFMSAFVPDDAVVFSKIVFFGSAFFKKPFNLFKLEEMIKKLLERRQWLLAGRTAN